MRVGDFFSVSQRFFLPRVDVISTRCLLPSFTTLQNPAQVLLSTTPCSTLATITYYLLAGEVTAPAFSSHSPLEQIADCIEFSLWHFTCLQAH